MCSFDHPKNPHTLLGINQPASTFQGAEFSSSFYSERSERMNRILRFHAYNLIIHIYGKVTYQFLTYHRIFRQHVNISNNIPIHGSFGICIYHINVCIYIYIHGIKSYHTISYTLVKVDGDRHSQKVGLVY